MLNIIYQDDDILVIDKPAGLVVDRSETQTVPTLEDWLQKKFMDSRFRGNDNGGLMRMGIVHRLDKDTSGVILVAKTQAALENLQAQFKQRKVKKEYLALVHGEVEKPGTVVGSIGRNPKNREKFMVFSGGKEAVTEYSPEGKFQIPNNKLQIIFNDLNKIQMRKLERMDYGKFTMLSCRPKTGRTHQIRVHLKYIGHPIVADEKYVGRKMKRLDHRWCPRQFLHANKISFQHPTSGRWVQFQSPLPDDLENVLNKLEN